MADVFSQEEIDSLLDIVEEDNIENIKEEKTLPGKFSLGDLTSFIKLFESETVSTIETLIGLAPSISLKDEQDLSATLKMKVPAVLINIDVNGAIYSKLTIVLSPQISTALSDMMMGEEQSNREDVNEDDLDATKEVIHSIFYSKENHLDTQKDSPLFSFKINNVEFVNSSYKDIKLANYHKLFDFEFNLDSLSSSIQLIIGDISSEISLNKCATLRSRRTRVEKKPVYEFDFDFDYNIDAKDSTEVNIFAKATELIDTFNTLDDESKKIKYTIAKEEKQKYEIFYYGISDKDELKQTIISYMQKAKEHGILSLEADVNCEVNEIIRPYLSMAIDGYETNTIYESINSRKIWLIKAYKYLYNNKRRDNYLENLEKEKNDIIKSLQQIQFTKNEVDSLRDLSKRINDIRVYINNIPPESIVEYIQGIEHEFNIVTQGILSTMAGDTKEVFLEKLEDVLNNKNEKLILDNTHNFNADKLDSEEITEFKEKIDTFNKQADSLNDKIVIEDPSKLIRRIVEYSTKARKDGLHALINHSIEDKNSFVRKLLQQIIFGISSVSATQLINESLQNAKDDSSSDYFLFEYERELTTIALGIKSIQAGETPRTIEKHLNGLYAEQLNSVF